MKSSVDNLPPAKQHCTMKTPFALVIPLVFTLFVAPVALSVGGCSSAGKTAYRTTATASVTVDAAMSAWGRWVKDHKPSAESELKVKSAFETYQKAVSTVADTGAAYQRAKEKPNNPALPEAQVKFNAAIAAASAALADLTNLIVSLGVKI